MEEEEKEKQHSPKQKKLGVFDYTQSEQLVKRVKKVPETKILEQCEEYEEYNEKDYKHVPDGGMNDTITPPRKVEDPQNCSSLAGFDSNVNNQKLVDLMG